MVVIPGYEGGYDDVIASKKTTLVFDLNLEEWYGRHEERAEPPSGSELEEAHKNEVSFWHSPAVNPPEKTTVAGALILLSNRRI